MLVGKLTLAFLALAACDPVDRITVRIPTQPGDKVTVHWVETYEGRTYASSVRVAQKVSSSAELVVARQECCGPAAAYRKGSLRFLACLQPTAGEATLVCGKVGDAPALYTRSTLQQQTCEALEQTVPYSDLDPKTCTLVAHHGP